MSCDCGECVSRQLLCIGLGNSKSFLFSVLDQDGEEVDIGSVADIVFSVSDGVSFAGNLIAGGDVRFEKTIANGGVVVTGTSYQFFVYIDPADTQLLVKSDNYYDVTITTSSGSVYTVKAGILRVTKTNVGIV